MGVFVQPRAYWYHTLSVPYQFIVIRWWWWWFSNSSSRSTGGIMTLMYCIYNISSTNLAFYLSRLDHFALFPAKEKNWINFWHPFTEKVCRTVVVWKSGAPSTIISERYQITLVPGNMVGVLSPTELISAVSYTHLDVYKRQE